MVQFDTLAAIGAVGVVGWAALQSSWVQERIDGPGSPTYDSGTDYPGTDVTFPTGGGDSVTVNPGPGNRGVL